MADHSGLNEPSAAHEFLQTKVGSWSVDCAYFADPKAEPMRLEGHDVVEAIGPYWTQGRFKSGWIQGVSVSGFDPVRGKFVSTWFDSSNPYLYSFEGELDEETGRLESRGHNVDPHSRKIVVYRSVEVLGSDERSLELYVESDANTEIKVLEYHYTRQAATN